MSATGLTQRIDSQAKWPLFNVAQTRSIETKAQATLSAYTLMQRAGLATAQLALAIAPHAQKIWIACGPGNNGGDGFVMARQLAQAGREVIVAFGSTADRLPAEAAKAHADYLAAGGTVVSDLPAAPANGWALVVDALFGIGLSRPLSGEALDAVQWMNERHALRLALDLPSGLDAERGTWVGGVAGVRAHATLSFLAAKAGLFTADGPDAAGAVEVADLEVSVPLTSLNLVEPVDFRHALAPRAANTHKGSYGRCAIQGGARGMVGAALIAARAALRLGAGRVYVDCLGAPELLFDPLQPELMFRPVAALPELEALVLGCGLGEGEAARSALLAALARSCPLVLDADALNLLAADVGLQADLLARSAVTVLTPHPAEAARLLRRSVAEVQSDRVAAARELAVATGSIVVLKGAGSVIALRSGRAWINPTGGPALATAGTGDALAGMLGAFFAQGYDMVTATLAAVWLHGRAARGSEAGLVASEVALRAATELDRLRGESSRRT